MMTEHHTLKLDGTWSSSFSTFSTTSRPRTRGCDGEDMEQGEIDQRMHRKWSANDPCDLRDEGTSRKKHRAGQHDGGERGLPHSHRTPVDDDAIVWPPVVILENTRVEYDQVTNKFRGLDSEEIRGFVRGLKADIDFKRTFPAYDKRGHKGKSLVTFAPNYLGFMEAEDLHERLQRSGRGRKHFEKVRPRRSNPYTMNGWDSPELLSHDGKRIIYGYLATPVDMDQLDHLRNSMKGCKGWKVESKLEKVLRPCEQARKEKEEQKVKLRLLEEEKQQIASRLESEMTDLGMLIEELERKTEEIQSRRLREQELQREHDSQLIRRTLQHEVEKRQIKEQYFETETRIRELLERNKEVWMAENAKAAESCRQLNEQKTNLSKAYEAEQRQLAAMRKMNIESALRVKMEKKLAALTEEQNKRKMALQEKQNQELLRLKEEKQKEKEELLKKNLAEQEKMKQEVEHAKKESAQIAPQIAAKAANCSKCQNQFNTNRPRALYDCGHANICFDCGAARWSEKDRRCFTCNKQQKVKPKSIYHQAFT